MSLFGPGSQTFEKLSRLTALFNTAGFDPFFAVDSALTELTIPSDDQLDSFSSTLVQCMRIVLNFVFTGTQYGMAACGSSPARIPLAYLKLRQSANCTYHVLHRTYSVAFREVSLNRKAAC
jgi:hypothetical protein